MKKAILALAAMLIAFPAYAEPHNHGSKGPNGGTLIDVAGVHVEFLPNGKTLSFKVLNESNKPITTKGYSGSVLIVSGADRETVSLKASGENELTGEANKPVVPGSSITLMIKTETGKMGQARYKG